MPMSNCNNYLKKQQQGLLIGVIFTVFVFYSYSMINEEHCPLPTEQEYIQLTKDQVPSKPTKNRQHQIPDLPMLPTKTNTHDTTVKPLDNSRSKHIKHRYKITSYYIPELYKYSPKLKYIRFDECEFSNCDIVYENDTSASQSDVVIFDGRFMKENITFSRPRDQVWIFASHESPMSYDDVRTWWRSKKWHAHFNWTMTYDREYSDIFLPYGELKKQTKPIVRNFTEITLQKNRTALMVASHCPTRSKREQFAKMLNKLTDVEVLGACGKPWKCGQRYKHDDCFKLLSSAYKFYLAFENAFCRAYFTEKFFNNFNYDTILISLGGDFAEASSIFPNGTFISTDSFNTVEDLGQYLKSLSVDDYAEMLQRKSQYYNVGYEFVYKRAMCDICKRMNNIETYRKQIPDIEKWAYNNTPCRKPNILTNLV